MSSSQRRRDIDSIQKGFFGAVVMVVDLYYSTGMILLLCPPPVLFLENLKMYLLASSVFIFREWKAASFGICSQRRHLGN